MNPEIDFYELAHALLGEQRLEWELLNTGYNSFSDVKLKTISLEGFNFNMQHNPQRLTSTAAQTDSESIMNRLCFLCEANRPKEQRGLLISELETTSKSFQLLCNPFPIYPLIVFHLLQKNLYLMELCIDRHSLTLQG